MSNSLADMLNFGDDDGSFDDDEAQKARERQEEREANAKILKEKLLSIQSTDDEEYKKSMIKLLQGEALDVLIHMKHDIEDAPSARGAEVFASLLSAMTNTVDSYEKINVNKEKLAIDQKKVLLRAENNSNSLISGDHNVIMVGSTNDVVKALEQHGLIEQKPSSEKEVEVEIIEESQEKEENQEK